MTSYDDSQRTQIVDDSQKTSDLTKKQENFDRILKDYIGGGQKQILLNYYKDWSRAYSLSESLLAYCLILILKYRIIPSVFEWENLNTRELSGILNKMRSEVKKAKGMSPEEYDMSLKLTVIRYHRLAEQFSFESNIAKVKPSISDILGTLEETEGLEETEEPEEMELPEEELPEDI